VASAVFLHATNWERVREIDLFALALAIQSLPFLASVALAVLESSRLNSFAFWQSLEARLGQMLTRRPAATTTPAPTVATVPADKQVEPAQ
jgi:glucan 1,3-beta-glucosidase